MKKAKKIKFKRKAEIIKILKYLFSFIVGISVLYNIIFLLNISISSKEYFNLFGISLFNIDNELMKDELNPNDLVIVKEVKENNLKEGDIIAYQVHGQIKISRIYNINDEKYTTKYNQAYYLNIEEIGYNQIIGKVIKRIPVFGLLLQISQNKITSTIVCILMLCAILYYSSLLKRQKLRERKKKMQTRLKGRN